MPSTYAHYRMGAALLPTFPADVRRTIQHFRRMYDVGLHGPDLFLYYNPILPGNTSALASKFHGQTGREFFQRLCRIARLEKSEAAQAYICGALCHYALDSVCNPFIEEQVAKGVATRGQIETEFDRYLLEKDGKIPPESQDLSLHLRLTPGECASVAKFYSPASSRQVQDCLRNMANQLKLFSVHEGTRRSILRKGLETLNLPVGDTLMTTGPNPKCAHLDEALQEKYDLAMEQFPELLNQLQAHLTYNGVFGEEFTKKFE